MHVAQAPPSPRTTAFYEDERDQLGKLVAMSQLPAAAMLDLERLKLSTISMLCSLHPTALTVAQPELPAVNSLLVSLHTSSVIIDAAAMWPDPNSADAATKAEVLTTLRALTKLCRLAGRESEKADKRELDFYQVGSSTAKGGDAQSQADLQKARRARGALEVGEWEKNANLTYNSDFDISHADPTAVIDSRTALERNQVRVGSLSGGKYTRDPVVTKSETTRLTMDDSNQLAEQSNSHVNLTRNGSVLMVLFDLLLTLVVAGCFPIDPTLAHLAVSTAFGKIHTAAGALQVHLTLWDAIRLHLVFTNLSAVLTAKTLESRIYLFFVEANALMRQGHSLSSASNKVIGEMPFMRVSDLSAIDDVSGLMESSSPATPLDSERTGGKGAARSPGGNRGAAEHLQRRKGGKFANSDGEILYVDLKTHEKDLANLRDQNAALKKKFEKGGGGVGRDRQHARFDDRGHDRGRDRDRDRDDDRDRDHKRRRDP